MTTRTHLNANTNGSKVDLPLVGQLFLKFGSSSAEISENGGPILIYEQDGVVTVKVETDAKGLLFNDHPVKKGGIYFFELGDTLKYKSTEITLSEVEIIQSKFSSSLDDFDFDKDNEETKIIVEENLDMTSLLNNPSKAQLLKMEVPKKKVEPKTELDKDSTLSFEIEKPVAKKIERPKITRAEPKAEFTRTSIDINELLKKSSEEIEVETPREKKSTKLDLSSVPKRSKGVNSYDDIRICGPFTRFFAFIASITICFTAYQYLNHEILTNYVQLITDFLFNKINYLSEYEAYRNQASDAIKFLFIYSGLELISTILFSTSLPLFIIGVTTSGSFITKRIKALLRLPLDLFSTVFFIFEFPILFGKRTVKEILTFSKIGYRSIIFKIFALPFLLALILISIFYTFLLDFKGEIHPKEIFSSSLYRESSAANYSNLSISKNIENNFEIIGTQSPTIDYLLTKKSNGSVLRIKEYHSLNFRKFEMLQKSIALFSIFYPNLNNYLNEETFVLDDVRRDIVKLIRSGEFQLLQNHENIEALNILSSNQMSKFLQTNQMNFEKIITVGEFTRIYEFKNEYTLIFISKDAVKLISINTNIEKISPYLQQIALNSSTTNPSALDQMYNSPNKVNEFLSSFSEKLNLTKSTIGESNLDSKIMFNKFLKDLQSTSLYKDLGLKQIIDTSSFPGEFNL